MEFEHSARTQELAARLDAFMHGNVSKSAKAIDGSRFA